MIRMIYRTVTFDGVHDTHTHTQSMARYWWYVLAYREVLYRQRKIIFYSICSSYNRGTSFNVLFTRLPPSVITYQFCWSHGFAMGGRSVTRRSKQETRLERTHKILSLSRHGHWNIYLYHRHLYSPSVISIVKSISTLFNWGYNMYSYTI